MLIHDCTIMEKDRLYTLSVLCDHPYLVSLFFAILLSIHLVTFLMFFYYLL